MAALTTYEFYTGTYYGDTVQSSDFPKWLAKATDELMFLTNNNIDSSALTTYSVQIQKAACALIDTMFNIDAVMTDAKEGIGSIASRSSGGESITYNTKSEGSVYDQARASVSAQRQLEYEAIRPYLSNTGLLYAGI